MAEDRKIVLSKGRASFRNPKFKYNFGTLSANANGLKLLTLSDVGNKEDMFDIREWSHDGKRADAYGYQILQEDIEDYAYIFSQFLSDAAILELAAARGLYLIANAPVMDAVTDAAIDAVNAPEALEAEDMMLI